MLMPQRVALGAVIIAAISPLAARADTLHVPAGTPVSVQVTGVVSSARAHVGDTVPLRVTEDVVVGGYVVIAHGAPGLAQVTAATPSDMNNTPGKLTLNYIWVQAVSTDKIGVDGVFSAQGSKASFGQTREQLQNLSQTASDQHIPQVKKWIDRLHNLADHAQIASNGGEAQLDPSRILNVGVHTNGVAIASNQRASVMTSANQRDLYKDVK